MRQNQNSPTMAEPIIGVGFFTILILIASILGPPLALCRVIQAWVLPIIPVTAHYAVRTIAGTFPLNNTLRPQTGFGGWIISLLPNNEHVILSGLLVFLFGVAFWAVFITGSLVKQKLHTAYYLSGGLALLVCIGFGMLFYVGHSDRNIPLVGGHMVTGSGTNLVVTGELIGPSKIRMGGSVPLMLGVWITNGVPVQKESSLNKDLTYSVEATLEAPTFDLPASATHPSARTLSLLKSAQWSWIITAKDKHLEDQTIQADVTVHYPQVTNSIDDVNYIRCYMYVTPPFGLPVWVYETLPYIISILVAAGTALIVGLVKRRLGVVDDDESDRSADNEKDATRRVENKETQSGDAGNNVDDQERPDDS